MPKFGTVKIVFACPVGHFLDIHKAPLYLLSLVVNFLLVTRFSLLLMPVVSSRPTVFTLTDLEHGALYQC